MPARAQVLTVVILAMAIPEVIWWMHGGGLPPALLSSLSIMFLSIGCYLQVRDLQKQIAELKRQPAAKR